MEIQRKHLAGAKQILQRCLGLRQGQSLVVFVDETTVDVGVVIVEAADILDIPQTMIKFVALFFRGLKTLLRRKSIEPLIYNQQAEQLTLIIRGESVHAVHTGLLSRRRRQRRRNG
ncbi:MAG: hypothetical protein KJ606_09835 [Chloroflexi bacterium]|nr:hypothetical protein [Chloroflexota bacterium]